MSAVEFDNIPLLLQGLPRWIVWRSIPEQDPTKKPRKVPYCARSGQACDATDPGQWSQYVQALSAYATGRYTGIGFCFAKEDGIVGLDFDHCYDPSTGVIATWAWDILQQISSYTEISPSGRGLKLFCLGNIPANHKKGEFEIYNQKRFFTVTGQHVGGTPSDVEDQSAAIAVLYDQYFPSAATPPPPPPPGSTDGFPGSDDELISIASRVAGGEKFKDLMAGNWQPHFPSASDADYSLINQLIFWCGPNPDRIDRIFRKSGLLRPKWDDSRGGQTYGMQSIAKALASYIGPFFTAAKTTPRAYHLTDLGNGRRFYDRYQDDLLYCNTWSQFLLWKAAYWKIDTDQEAKRWGEDLLGELYQEHQAILEGITHLPADDPKREEHSKSASALFKHLLYTEKSANFANMLKESQKYCGISPEQLDQHLWLFNTPTATLDLKTGTPQPHRRDDFLTQLHPLAYDPQASCPRWEQFLSEIMGGNDELVDFLWKAIGYSLTGNTREDCLFLLYGSGANGKTTFQQMLRKIAGPYSKVAAFSTFLHQDRDTIRNDLADLRGVRLVTAGENEAERRLSESVIKKLTGRDAIKARFLFQNYFEFEPQMKLWLATNYKPVIRGTDYAIWRRIRLIPFTQKFEGANEDTSLEEKLLAELPGIIAWAVRGCQAWLAADRLPLPDAVKAATNEYRTDMDTVGNWIDERCQPVLRSRPADLLNDYVAWGGEKTMSMKAFTQELLSRGYQRSPDRRWWLDLSLNP